MDFEIEKDLSTGPGEGSKTTESKVKSPTRMRYEAEVQVLKKQNGNLDEIRLKLGLSRRRICQILLVDPSAWTRWTAPDGDAPPHIYQSLDWYLALMEKDPEYRRLSTRIAGWLNREKNFEGRLNWIEEAVKTPRLEPISKADKRVRPMDWWDFAVPLLTFVGGMIAAYFFLT